MGTIIIPRSLRMLWRKILTIPKAPFFFSFVIACIGWCALYSVANKSLQPWALKQMVRFGVCIALAICISLINIRIFFRYSYWIYGVSLCALIAVSLFGAMGMGARRWISTPLLSFQPSEVMKVVLILVLARVLSEKPPTSLRRLIVPSFLVLVPALLVLKQPDLGTAFIIGFIGLAMFWSAGVSSVILGGGLLGTMILTPFFWRTLRPYQQKRIMTFLFPEVDPLGQGYHILQSKIGLGSGCLWGKGFLGGSQNHLGFLPERHTDFIFSSFCEEFGFIGAIVLIATYGLLLLCIFTSTINVRSEFVRLLSAGVMIFIFAHVFINMGMTVGILPVVGVPLPLLSYGGTSLLSFFCALGLFSSAYTHEALGRS